MAQGTQPVISYAYAPDRITTNYDYDPEKAKALLAEAGWTDTDGDGIVDKDGQPFAFEMIYQSGSPTVDQMVAYMQDAWQAIGVEMTPRAMEFAALVEMITGDHNFDVATARLRLGRHVHPGRHVRLRPIRGWLQHGQVLQ